MKNKIWEDVKQDLLGYAPGASVWLDGTELLHLANGGAVIFVESEFARSVVQERFGERIADLLKNYCRHHVEVRFVGKDGFFSIPAPKKQDEDPVLSSLTKLMLGLREAGVTLDSLIAQLDCVIEEIEAE